MKRWDVTKAFLHGVTLPPYGHRANLIDSHSAELVILMRDLMMRPLVPHLLNEAHLRRPKQVNYVKTTCSTLI